MKDKLVRLQVVADRYGVSARVIRNAIADGHIKGYRLPGSRLIFVDIEEYEAKIKPVQAVQL